MTVRFTFDEDQLLFQASLKNLLAKECTPEDLRAACASDTGRSRERWTRLAEMGLLGLLVPEEHGGLGRDETDMILLLEETGWVALPEPVVETAAVGAPLLAALDRPDVKAEWLPRVVAGEVIVTVGHDANPFVCDAHVADLLLLQHGDEIHAVARADTTLERQPCNDPARRLFRVEWTPAAATCVSAGDEGRRLLDAAFDRAALATAAQELGIGRRLVDMAVRYATDRQQFGKPIGSFQAVKHMLASVAVRIEFARAVVYRAAFSVARNTPGRPMDVSHGKAAASSAAVQAAKVALQVHGAIGYTWEVDLHMWMKRAWALEAAWGNGLWHRRRIGAAILDGDTPVPTFGDSAPA